MSVIATAIRFMRQGGMKDNEIVEAVLAMEAEADNMRSPYLVDEAAARRRAKDRERKANVRRQSADSPQTSEDGSPSNGSPTPLPITTPSVSPNGDTGADAPQPVYSDSKHELWGEGTAILVSLGLREKSARTQIGRWMRDTGNDAQKVLGAIQRARDHRVIEPVAWITRALHPEKSNVQAASATIAQTLEQRLAAFDDGTPSLRSSEGGAVVRLLSEG